MIQRFRTRLAHFFHHQIYHIGITLIVLVNSLVLGLDTADFGEINAIFRAVDQLCIGIFTAELVLRLFAFGFSFFTNKEKGWNIFDFIIILLSLLESFGLSIFRFFRVFRTLRLLSVLPGLRFVVEAMLVSLPRILSIGVVLSVFYYVYAVFCVFLFGEAFPQWFGNLGRSLYTLFQIMTLEGWSDGIVRPVMELYAYAWIVFISFILIVSCVVLNLVVGVIVESISELKTQKEQEHEKRKIP